MKILHFNWFVLGILLLIFSFSGSGCGKNEENLKIVSIEIRPSSLSVAKGDIAGFKAFLRFSDGSDQDVTEDVSWRSADIRFAEISSESEKPGVFIGLREGKAAITAVTSDNIQARAELNILPPELVAINILPENLSVHTGYVQQFKAIGTYSDGQSTDVTDLVDWSSSNRSTPIISNMPGSKGLGISPPAGSSTISATDPKTGVRGSTTLSVTTTKLVSISVTPSRASVFKGGTLKFTAVGTYVDGSTNDITESVIWTSSNPSVAEISNASGSNGVAACLSSGTARIKATDPTIIISGSASLTVKQPELKAIAVSPSGSAVFPGKVQLMTAIGTYSNGMKKDITQMVKWTSSNSSVASIGNAEGYRGIAVPLSAGTTAIRAFHPLSGISGASKLIVKKQELVSILVQPENQTVLLGNSRKFSAEGLYSNGSKKNISNRLVWISSNPAVAKIDKTDAEKAEVISKSAGRVSIIALDPVSKISGKASMNVIAPSLVSVAVVPEQISLPAGRGASFTAIGTLNTGETKEMTKTLIWFSSDPRVAKINGQTGVLNSRFPGKTVISAQDPETKITGQAVVEITNAELVSIEVRPGKKSVSLGQSHLFNAIGLFSDGKTRVITKEVVWSSSDESAAKVNNRMEQKGLATSLSIGEVNVVATDPETGIHGTAILIGRALW